MEKLIKWAATRATLTVLMAVVLLAGCKTSRKVTESSEVKSSVNTEENRSVKENKDFKENKDVNSELETVTVKTTKKYYPPTASPSTPLESSGSGGAVSPSTGSGTGGVDNGDRRPETETKGALMEETTETTTTNKKDQDKSKLEANSEKQEDTKAVRSSKSEVRSEKKEVKQTGVSNWKVIGGLVVLLLVVYFLVKKNIIRIPFLTKIVERITRILNGLHGKAA